MSADVIRTTLVNARPSITPFCFACREDAPLADISECHNLLFKRVYKAPAFKARRKFGSI